MIKESSGQGVIPDRRWLLLGNALFLFYFVAKLRAGFNSRPAVTFTRKWSFPFPYSKRSPRA